MTKYKNEITVSMIQANLYSLPIVIFLMLLMVGSYILIWDKALFLEGFRNFRSSYTYLILLLGFLIHEIIHICSYLFFGNASLKDLKIGFQFKTVTPYAHCSKSMTITAYRISALMPGLMLGLLPAIISLILGNAYLFILAIIFTVAAGGDLLLIYLLRNVSPKELVKDHPHKAGCLVLDNEYQI